MRLPKHAVGFWHAGSTPFPEVDVDALARAVRHAAHPSGTRLDTVERTAYPRSFHVLRLRNRTEEYDLLCGQHLAWLGFCRAAPEYAGFDVDAVFGDPPAWAHPLADLGHRLLSRTELLTPAARIDTSELTPEARAQVEHWRPNHLAEFLFNWWD